jgi:hypothetical protein
MRLMTLGLSDAAACETIDAKQVGALATAAAAPRICNGLEIVEIDPDSPRGNRKRQSDDARSSSSPAAAAATETTVDASDVETPSSSQKRHKPNEPSNNSK